MKTGSSDELEYPRFLEPVMDQKVLRIAFRPNESQESKSAK